MSSLAFMQLQAHMRSEEDKFVQEVAKWNKLILSPSPASEVFCIFASPIILYNAQKKGFWIKKKIKQTGKISSKMF